MALVHNIRHTTFAICVVSVVCLGAEGCSSQSRSNAEADSENSASVSSPVPVSGTNLTQLECNASRAANHNKVSCALFEKGVLAKKNDAIDVTWKSSCKLVRSDEVSAEYECALGASTEVAAVVGGNSFSSEPVVIAGVSTQTVETVDQTVFIAIVKGGKSKAVGKVMFVGTSSSECKSVKSTGSVVECQSPDPKPMAVGAYALQLFDETGRLMASFPNAISIGGTSVKSPKIDSVQATNGLVTVSGEFSGALIRASIAGIACVKELQTPSQILCRESSGKAEKVVLEFDDGTSAFYIGGSS